MIKAVFFDWFNTLAYYYPPREGLHASACNELGIAVEAEGLAQSLAQADQLWFDEEARYPIRARTPQEQREVYIQYERTVLQGGGITIDDELLLRVIQRVWRLVENSGFALYDDVLPTLNMLKQRGLVMGVISNIRKDMLDICNELKLIPLLDFIVTSAEVGADKPQPAIFQAALHRAKVTSSEAAHVGDQYSSDVIGARGAGIKPILIDRYHLCDEIIDCPRISRLDELSNILI